MYRTISTEKKPIKLWVDNPDDGTMAQVKNLANLPFVFKHVCLMPDAHVGYGMPIGGILATDGVIVPNAVGVDIGCGMYAVKTNLHHTMLKRSLLLDLCDKIRACIPVGFNHHKAAQDAEFMPLGHDIDELPIVKQQYRSALKQVGTLGGGNHFIEIQKDSQGFVWIMIHSGSRNIGLKVAEHYNSKAKHLNKLWFSDIDPKFDLAFLPFGTHEAHTYYKEMKYCVDFALANRKLMIMRVMECVSDLLRSAEFSQHINIAHNYATWEEHFGQNVIVHRKGATSAKKGEIGIIPGSQGTKSYIVEGLGNEESFMSCSHGAGRVMGRNQAIKNLNFDEEKKKLDDLGIIHAMNKPADLEEASAAYKDIDRVMQLQRDLVQVKVELLPMAVIKG